MSVVKHTKVSFTSSFKCHKEFYLKFWKRNDDILNKLLYLK